MMKKILKITATVLSLTIFLICMVSFIMIIISSKKNTVPSIFNFSLMSISSQSMEPTYNVGDLVIVKKVDPNTLKKDDVISFYSSDPSIAGKPNTHRIVDIIKDGDKISFVTQGDNNETRDDYYVDSANVIGKVVKGIPSVGKAIIYLQHSKLVYFLIIILPMFLIFAFEMKNVMTKYREGKKDE